MVERENAEVEEEEGERRGGAEENGKIQGSEGSDEAGDLEKGGVENIQNVQREYNTHTAMLQRLNPTNPLRIAINGRTRAAVSTPPQPSIPRSSPPQPSIPRSIPPRFTPSQPSVPRSIPSRITPPQPSIPRSTPTQQVSSTSVFINYMILGNLYNSSSYFSMAVVTIVER